MIRYRVWCMVQDRRKTNIELYIDAVDMNDAKAYAACLLTNFNYPFDIIAVMDTTPRERKWN